MLGPTNTGKTHLAIERMVAHKSGMIGLPLRLLAREVYDRVVKLRGPRSVALITGEERIVPPNPSYWVATVEAMPLDIPVRFLAIDEIQLVQDRERGHVFTNRLLHARGLDETMLLGSATMVPLIRHLLPDAYIQSRPRFSTLDYAGSKKLTRLPRRSAIVGFSADQVYAMAELIRRQRGGAAVVMGGLSPRTRNAQVDMYQSGEVDFLVATDAIGMGLNLDLTHVAFAATQKFDGVSHRGLRADELAQIAGRAGRYRTDGTFGTTADAPFLDEDIVEAILNSEFEPVRHAQWRHAALEFGSLSGLLHSLDRPPPAQGLVRAREQLDQRSLRALSQLDDVRDSLSGPARLKQLWEVAQIPDFRSAPEEVHIRLLKTLFDQLTGQNEQIGEDWLQNAVRPLDNLNGDIDALQARIAHIRTFTYLSHKSAWLQDAQHWQERTREIEDALSDALHQRLTQRFVDRRTSVLLRKLKEKDPLMGSVTAQGDVIIEDERVGTITGFTFTAAEDQSAASGADNDLSKKTLAEAIRGPVSIELAARAHRLLALFDAGAKADAMIAQSAEKSADTTDGEDKPQDKPAAPSAFKAPKEPPAPVSLEADGRVTWDGAVIANLKKGTHKLRPELVMQAAEWLDPAIATQVEIRLGKWLQDHIDGVLAPIAALRDGEMESGVARGIAFELVENMGVLPRDGEIAERLRALDQAARGELRQYGVRFGEMTLFQPAILKPRQVQLRLLLWQLADGIETLPEIPTAGLCSTPALKDAPQGFYEMCGFRQCGRQAVRIDMLERLSDMLRPLNASGPFEVSADHMSIVGCSGEEFTSIMLALGYRSREGQRDNLPEGAQLAPKAPEQIAKEERERAAAEAAQAEAAAEPAPKPAGGAEANAEDITAAPSAEKAADTPAIDPNAVVLWRLKRGARHIGSAAPARRNNDDARDNRGGNKGSGRGGDNSQNTAKGGRPDNRGGKGGKGGKGGGKRGERGDRGARQNKPRNFSSGGGNKRREPDPNSPFAALKGLKDQLNKGSKD